MNEERTASVIAALLLLAVPANASIELVECPKCANRIRILDDGKTATVNLSRLKDDAPDEGILSRRTEAMKARAEKYLAFSRNRATGDRKCPMMGWSSWNTFGIEISEGVILDMARAMVSSGLKDAGYVYVNIDDGFFGGRGPDGALRFHPMRFPNGMKGTVDGIHALGLRAGTYSDAGADTCGSIWSNDALGRGSGLYQHDAADCKLHFQELFFDFIKVDYCGGKELKLDERERYMEVANAIKASGRTDVRLNICRWGFPGTWAAAIADSWRTTDDIRANWRNLRNVIWENLYLSAYASAGHYNDMDMLEVGQRKGFVKSAFGALDTGLTETEEVAHFGLWCMMSSPLMIGCDVRKMPEFTRKLVTNPYLIAMDQNGGLGVQGYVAQRMGETYVIVKDADHRFGLSRYVALYNASDSEEELCVRASALDLGGSVAAFDLVEKADVGAFEERIFVKVPAHGAKFYRFDSEKRLERRVYEAETAYLTDYQEIKDADEAYTASPVQRTSASGGVAVKCLGKRPSNDLVWKNMKIEKGGKRTLEFQCSSPVQRVFMVELDGVKIAEVTVKTEEGVFERYEVEVNLPDGLHAIRLFNDAREMPEIDRMVLR